MQAQIDSSKAGAEIGLISAVQTETEASNAIENENENDSFLTINVPDLSNTIMPTGAGAFGFFPGMIAQISAETDDFLQDDTVSLHA